MKPRTKSSISPTARTMKALREMGYEVGRVESFNAHVGPYGVRMDLFGMFDLLAFNDLHTIGVQCGAGSGHRQHVRKIVENELAPLWLENPERLIWVYSWRKVCKKRGGKAMVWSPRVEHITLETISSQEGETEQ